MKILDRRYLGFIPVIFILGALALPSTRKFAEDSSASSKRYNKKQKLQQQVKRSPSTKNIKEKVGDDEYSPNLIRRLLNSMDNRAFIGKKDAPVEIHIFQDIKCGMCAYAYKNLLPEIEASYVSSGEVKVVFHEFPLGLRGRSFVLARAVRCALNQGHYHEYLKKLYFADRKSEPEGVVQVADQLGLDRRKFSQCMKDENISADLEELRKIGENLNIDGTPTFFINGKRLNGVRPFAEIKTLIQKQLMNKETRELIAKTTG